MNQDDNKQGEIRHQTADGIQECDNPLPRWWVGLFILTGVFGVVYILYVHVFGGKGQIEKYNLAQAQRESAAAIEESQELNAGESGSKTAEPADLATAEADYQTNCAACHMPDGSGSIGPNLTDAYWIHGGDEASISNIIQVGVLEKGMPPWKDILGVKRINAMTALIVSWRGKDLKGKDPEGEKFEPTP